jgi:hypothetical protein
MRMLVMMLTLILAVPAAGWPGEEDEPEAEQGEQEGDDLRAKVQNPVGSLISLPFQFRFDYGAPNGEASFLNIQPVYPVRVGEWNLINRAIVPVIDSPGEVAGTEAIPNPIPGNGAFGLGDINYSMFLSPAEPGEAIWGIGPSLTMPTATDDELGSEKWSAGPTAVLLAQPKPWSLGVLGRHVWSFTGDDDRADVNQTLLEPFINYNLNDGWYLVSDLVMIANWEAQAGDRWTVPIGGGVGKLVKVGKQAINFRLEYYYNAIHPDSAPEWQWGFTVQLLFPK